MSRRDHVFRDGGVSVLELGSGPDLLVLHGMMGNPAETPFMQHLAQAFRVVAPSLPGFMPSPGRDDLRTLYDWIFTLSELVDSLGLAGAPVVASSVGAMLALELAAVRREAFSRLAVIAPLGLWVDEDPVADLFGVTSGEQQGMLLRHPERAALFFKDEEGGEEEQIEHGVSRYRTMRSAAQLVWPIPERGLIERLPRVTCPTAVVWGAEDALAPVSYAARFAAALPGKPRPVIIPGAGHCADWDEPAAVARAVLAFLEPGLINGAASA